MEKLAAEVLKLGTPTAIVANAAEAPMRTLDDVTNETYDHLFNLNCKGVLFLIKALSPHMPKGSAICLLSTIATTFSTVPASYLEYAATKGAIEQMNRVLAKELFPKGIRTNVIRPGPIDT